MLRSDVAAHQKKRLACWNIIYQASETTLATLRHKFATPGHTTFKKSAAWEDLHGFQFKRGCASRNNIRRLPLVATCDGHRLHGDDREPAIWLDAVRRSDRCKIPLGTRGDPARLHALRGDRDLARAGRGLVRR